MTYQDLYLIAQSGLLRKIEFINLNIWNGLQLVDNRVVQQELQKEMFAKTPLVATSIEKFTNGFAKMAVIATFMAASPAKKREKKEILEMANDDILFNVAKLIYHHKIDIDEFYQELGIDLDDVAHSDPELTVARLAGIFDGWENSP